MCYFFFNDTATTEIYTLSLHDALPISSSGPALRVALFITCFNDTLFPETGRATVRILERLGHEVEFPLEQTCCGQMHLDRKSTRLNSSHANISYAVFCLKKITSINIHD